MCINKLHKDATHTEAAMSLAVKVKLELPVSSEKFSGKELIPILPTGSIDCCAHWYSSFYL
ncbi:hypothetical protein KDI_54550 [Dictyobacter arantiisoli]|uniref:Uncharacterized protein n=1 Tax=Dictyobacter arantiisoli TaxID=2014874 RepID=A0A5A5TJU6_9CHLR|nr:hypothetical protein KDI_54550 [Dictyobacter arantiisoli]